MRARRAVRSVLGVTGLIIAMGMGCGGDNSSPGPGGATITGNILTASTASLQKSRRTWLAWAGENLVGLARTAYAQAADSSVDGITVIARGQGREVSDLTGGSGDFVITDAPTGDVDIVLRRGGCEGTLPLGNVISNSTITLEDVDFTCPSGTGTGLVDPAGTFEVLQGVIRNDDDPESAVTLCVRQGNDDRDRDVDFETADLEDEDGRSTSFASFRTLDLVEVSGERIGTGDSFDFHTDLVRLRDRDVRDDCSIPG